MEKKIGHYSFIVGVILAIILGLFSTFLGAAAMWLTSLLVLLGLVVGFLNVTGKETKEFLLVATILVIVSFAGGSGSLASLEAFGIGAYLVGIFEQIMAFVIPAAIVVALKDVLSLAQNPQ